MRLATVEHFEAHTARLWTGILWDGATLPEHRQPFGHKILPRRKANVSNKQDRTKEHHAAQHGVNDLSKHLEGYGWVTVQLWAFGSNSNNSDRLPRIFWNHTRALPLDCVAFLVPAK